MVERTSTPNTDTADHHGTSQWGTREALETSLAVGGAIAGAILLSRCPLARSISVAKMAESLEGVLPRLSIKPSWVASLTEDGGTLGLVHSAPEIPSDLESATELDSYESRLRQFKTAIAEVKLPESGQVVPAKPEFMPSTASALDAFQLGLSDTIKTNDTGLGDEVLRIKSYVNTSGKPARDYLAQVVRENDITIIGERHTGSASSSHRLMGIDALRDLPEGSTLAVELPAQLKPFFDEFNSNVGANFNLSKALASAPDIKPLIPLLKRVENEEVETFQLWKSLRDRGVKIIPIDAGPELRGPAAKGLRESFLSRELLAAHNNSGSSPTVAWLGNAHAARVSSVPWSDGINRSADSAGSYNRVAKQISEVPAFAEGRKKLATVFSQMSEADDANEPLYALAAPLKQAVALPVKMAGQETPVANLSVVSREVSKILGVKLETSDYDHLVLYPPMHH